MYAWCYFDTKARQFRLSQNLRKAVFLLGLFAVPYYFVCTRGFKAASKTGFGLLLYVPFYVLYYVVWFGTVSVLRSVRFYA